MKKVLIATLIASLFLLGACSEDGNKEEILNEKNLSQENATVLASNSENPELSEEVIMEEKTNELSSPSITNYTYVEVDDGLYIGRGVVTIEFNHDNETMPEKGKIYHTLIAVYQTADGDSYEFSFGSAPVNYSEIPYDITESIDRDLTGEMYVYTDIINEDTPVWRSEKSESIFIR